MPHCSFSMIKKQQQQHICGVSKDQKSKSFHFLFIYIYSRLNSLYKIKIKSLFTDYNYR